VERLRARGLTVAIDDFGTGFSSLAYLRRLPADLIKIDRSFVQELGNGGESRTEIAELIIRLAERLGLRVLAEGVETEAQAGWLRMHGCHYAQGWLYARAMPLDALLDWLARREHAGT
ncbi:MAG TPA: EAL domain-containing protein, partial [Plasticicumulans sp.]|nr:EAL domain-containing protein [Plasticicumulans sp.]